MPAMKLNRQQLREMDRQNAKWPAVLSVVPRSEWPPAMLMARNQPVSVLRSRDFLVQIFPEPDHVVRITVCRTTYDNATGRWKEGITWDELQRLKREAGFGDLDAVEVYPNDADVINVASMRHLFVLPTPLTFAWRNGA